MTGDGSVRDADGWNPSDFAGAIVDTVREPLVVLDGELRVKTANRSFYRAFRVRPEDTEGRLLYDLGNRQWDIPALRTLLEGVLPRQAAFDDFEVEHEFPEIGRKVMLLNARKVWREGNHTELILLAVEDVTALRDAERARREAETRFTEMVRNVRDHSIFLTDPAGVITSWNVAAERIIGYTEAEAVGQPFSLIFTPEDVAAGTPEEELRQAREQGRAEDERWHVRKDGTRFWALGIVTPLHDEGGRLAGYSKVLRDMTDRKRAEEELAASREQLRAVFGTTQDAILLADDDARYIDANPAACTLLGFDRDDLVGRTVFDVTPAANGDAGRAAWAAFLRDGRQAGEYEVRRRDGATAVVEYRAVARVQPGVHLSALRDVTDRRRTQEALRESEERFARFMSHLPGLAWVKDDQGRYVYANDAAARAFGRPPADLYGRTDEEVFPPDTARQFRENDRDALAGGAGVRAVETLTHPDGTPHHSLVSKFRIPGTDGRPALVGGVAIDITEEMRTRAVLEESEERFRATFDQAAVGIAHVGTDGRWLRVNRKLCDIVGYPPDELLGLTFQDITHPDDVEADLAQLRKLVAGEIATYAMEKRYVRKDRRTVWINLTVSLARTPQGEPKYLISVVEDVTAKKAVEDALRDSEQKYRTVLESITDAFFAVDRDWRFTYVNRQAETLLGRTPGDLPGTGLWDEYPGLAGSEFERAYRQVMAGRVAASVTAYYPDHDRWYEVHVFPAEGGISVYFRDVSERVRADAALRAGEERFRTLFEAMDEGYCVIEMIFDPPGGGRAVDYRFLEVNPAFEAQSGLRDATGRRMREFVTDIEDHWLANYGRVALTGEPIRFANEYTGLNRWFEVYAFRVGGEGSRRVGVLFTDITRRKQAEADRERLVGQLRDADRRKDDFLATLAHELRNPLAPLRNGLQVMKLAAGNAGAVEQARSMMERQLGQMVHLIDDLLDVSRISRGKIALKRERVDLAGVVQSAVEASRPLIEASAHRLAVALPPDPVYLDADPTRLAQVFSNLLNNAAKYTERGGHIRLAAAQHGEEVVVAVEDTGIGIATDHLPRLFEMFSQVDSALERSQGGLGIGLSLVKGLVEMHGGTVAAHSDGLGRGSRFVVRLPAADGPAAAPGGDGGGAGTPASRRRILVADDNRDGADSLAMMLRLAGHEVHAAHGGQEALDAAGWFRPDLALLDIGMPKLNGLDVARRIREQPWGRQVVLVAITGWGQEEDRRRSTEAGFDHHLTKPVDPAALEKLLAGLTARR